jgi:hypothetical protein
VTALEDRGQTPPLARTCPLLVVSPGGPETEVGVTEPRGEPAPARRSDMPRNTAERPAARETRVIFIDILNY